MTILEKPRQEEEQSQKPVASLSFALVEIVNKDKKFALNKDLNGGLGTADDYSGFWGAGFVRNWRGKGAFTIQILNSIRSFVLFISMNI